MTKKNVIVTIPVYKSTLSSVERSSFLQCLRILHRHDITLITYPQLDTTEYRKIAKAENLCLQIVTFDESFFSSVSGYNRLMLDRAFYERFNATYNYILIYQLDAWVFHDSLDEWCDAGYDYIGAPTMFIKKDHIESYKHWSVGNGGLSLRRCSFCLSVLSFPPHKPLLSISGLLKTAYTWRMKLAIPLKIFGFQNTLSYYLAKGINEDQIFSYYIQHSYHPVELPTIEKALEFAFESHPTYSYQLIGKKLPFGCHAFLKNEYDCFWRKCIHINE